MKTKIMVLVVIALAISYSSVAQLKIDSNGNVGIGTTSPQYPIHIIGETKVSGETTFQGESTLKVYDSGEEEYISIVTENYGNYLLLRPESSLGGRLGSSSKLWSAMYSNYIYYYSLVSLSDSSLKENISSLEDPLN